MIAISNLSYSYLKSGRKVLSDLNLKIEAGTINGLLGPNGAGKSTLLYLICGLLKPQSGEIVCNGYTPYNRDVDFLRDTFLVSEEFSLPPVNLKQFIDINAPFYPKFDYQLMLRNLETFELSNDLHLARLSMGQKKRVLISFALACNTSLLILDEPTNGLDIPGKRMFRKVLLNSMSDDKTVIISTHQVYDVEKIIDHVIITDGGEIKLDESVTSLTSKFRFLFTTDRARIQTALIALDAPGGWNIIELAEPGDEETEINLESLFELMREKIKANK